MCRTHVARPSDNIFLRSKNTVFRKSSFLVQSLCWARLISFHKSHSKTLKNSHKISGHFWPLSMKMRWFLLKSVKCSTRWGWPSQTRFLIVMKKHVFCRFWSCFWTPKSPVSRGSSIFDQKTRFFAVFSPLFRHFWPKMVSSSHVHKWCHLPSKGFWDPKWDLSIFYENSHFGYFWNTKKSHFSQLELIPTKK